MAKPKSITQTISQSEFKKYINYHLAGRGTVKRIGTFSAKRVIFQVIYGKDNGAFNISNCTFLSAFTTRDKLLKVDFYFNQSDLVHLVGEVEFFNRDVASKTKMNFPSITLKI